MKQVGLKIIITLLIISCSNNNYIEYEKLISDYESLDFKTFTGLEIRNRGTDKDGNTILLVFEKNSLVYDATIIVDKKSNNIISIETIKGNPKEKQFLNTIVSKFIKINVLYLKVDYDKNVFINSFNFEHYNLVKVQNTKTFFINRNKDNFRQIIGNWYLFD